MVQELYLKYKDRYFEDFFTPEVRDLPKDKKELLLSELETMRKSTKIMENRLYTGCGKYKKISSQKGSRLIWYLQPDLNQHLIAKSRF